MSSPERWSVSACRAPPTRRSSTSSKVLKVLKTINRDFAKPVWSRFIVPAVASSATMTYPCTGQSRRDRRHCRASGSSESLNASTRCGSGYRQADPLHRGRRDAHPPADPWHSEAASSWIKRVGRDNVIGSSVRGGIAGVINNDNRAQRPRPKPGTVVLVKVENGHP
jgi:hypothetical protein